MTYSTGWTAEATKAHGDGLDVRIYARRVSPVTITNYYDPATGRMRPTILAGNGWSFSEVGIYSPPIVSQPVYKFAGTGASSMFIEYKMGDGELQLANKVLFSAYIHSGSSSVGYLGFFPGLAIVSYTGAGSTLEQQNYIKVDSDGADGFTIASTAGTHFYSGGIENVGDGWSRLWVIVNQPATNRATRDYSFRMLADRDTSNTVYSWTYMSSPMIEIDEVHPGPFLYQSQIVNHPGELIELAAFQETVNINPLVRKRERDFGVAQGQKVQLEISNVALDKMTPSLMNAWVAVQFGFAAYNEWETVYQGRIVNATCTTDLTLGLELDEAVMNLLEAKLKRDTYFGLTPSVGQMKSVTKASSSSNYNNTSGGITINSALSGSVRDETYTIKFDSSTSFRVYNEHDVPLLDNTKNFDATGTTFAISGNASFSPAHYVVTGANVLTISKSGWTTGASAYASGDCFSFTTSALRTTTELTPLGMIKHLIEDVAGITTYDVVNGIYYDSPFSDSTFFASKSGATIGSIGGEWKAGTRIIEMVQDALKLEHMSIFPTEDGRIGLWSLSDIRTGTTLVNGDPSNNDVNLKSGQVTDTLDSYANVIVVNYLDAETGEAVSTKVEYPNKPAVPVEMSIDTKWRVQDVTALTCGSRALYRFNNTKRLFNLETTLALADVDLTEPVTVYDPFLAAYGEPVVVVERAIDLANQSIKLVAWNDPLAGLTIARIDYTTVGSTEETIW